MKRTILALLIICLIPFNVWAEISLETRVAVLETKLDLIISRVEQRMDITFAEHEKGIGLARERVQNDLMAAKNEIDLRLHALNEAKQRIERLEATFATKTQVDAISKLVYAGAGIVGCLQLLLVIYIKRTNGHSIKV